VRHAGSAVPPSGTPGAEEFELVAAARSAQEQVRSAFDRFAVHEATAAIWRLIAEANRTVDRTRPWTFTQGHDAPPSRVRADALRLGTILYHLLEALRVAAVLVEPILPTSARRLLRQLGADPSTGHEGLADWGLLRPGSRLRPDGVLFPRTRC
jgi:methionyl-tRNA synthetase